MGRVAFYIKSHLTWGVEKCHNVYLTFNTLNMQWKQHEHYTTTIVEKVSNKHYRKKKRKRYGYYNYITALV